MTGFDDFGKYQPSGKGIANEKEGEEDESKASNSSSTSLKDFSSIKGDATNRVVSRKLNLGLNMNLLKSLDLLRGKRLARLMIIIRISVIKLKRRLF